MSDNQQRLAHWTGCEGPRPVILDGRYARLEPLDPVRHGEDLYRAGSGPEVDRLWRYLGDRPFADRISFEPWLTRSAASQDPLFFTVVDKATGRVGGRLALMRIDRPHGVIEIGNILFGPDIAGTRVASAAVYLLARHVFDDLGYRRLEWKCNDLNEPSKRAALRYGFSPEGLFRQHMVVKGENRDTAWFAMLDRDWPGRKMAFEAWLSPENFDADGRQRVSLSDLMREWR
ncbi:GNAT family N-acetyltransferase [Microvirga brassicacearum]|uniref:GNAT family N-acetyltransferase n=1 Tax=Microvirga brassicacearum TaxID=2580413 RepID=A0A5N3P6E6_9HYPH|nr:GNAT family protein [Microvirga brassicacearum]KAB0265304.1 GNAT family N-acetyltransferase [Microvirga brassicacearum]